MTASIRTLAALVAGAALALTGVAMTSPAAAKAEPMIGHMVFFELNDNSPEMVRKLIAACDKYLDKHDGVVYYSAGARGKEFDRPVNAKDWDVALHLVFKSKADHDKYQDHPRHTQFIDENKANWKSVKVYDSHVAVK